MSLDPQIERRGFTIIEMLIVIAIAGILGTVSVGYMLSARPHADVERSELVLSGELNLARNIAISNEVATRVVFDDGTGEFWTESLNRQTGAWAEVTPHKTLPGNCEIPLAQITFPGSVVRFTPRGTLMSGGSITIQNELGETSVLQGNLATGRFSPGGGNLR